MPQSELYKIALALEAKDFQQKLQALKQSWGVFTSAIEQTQGSLWNATVLGFQMSMAGRNWAENLFEVANQADVIRLKLASFEQAVRTSGESLDEGTEAVKRLADQFQILPDQVANAMGLLLRKGFKIKEAIPILERFADSAVNVGRNIADGMEAGASALLQERSILLNSVGIAENISTAFNKYAKQLHKSVQALTEAEKRQALMNLVMESTANRVGLAKEFLAGFRGQVQRLSKEWRQFIRDFGKGIAAAFSPFIVSANAVLKLLNAMPKGVRVAIGAMSTLGALTVFLGGVIFLTISNLLRFVTTIKQTMADTIKSVSLAVTAYKESVVAINNLGLASAAASRELDALSLKLIASSIAADAPTFGRLINQISFLTSDSKAAREAVAGLGVALSNALGSSTVGSVASIEKLKSELASINGTLDDNLLGFRKFEIGIIATLRRLSGKRHNLDDLIQLDPATLVALEKAGLKVTRASKVVTLAERALRGEAEMSAQQLAALRTAIADVAVAYGSLAAATKASAEAAGIRGLSKLAEQAQRTEASFMAMRNGLEAAMKLQRLGADDFIDVAQVTREIEAGFEKAGMKAALVFKSGFDDVIAAGGFMSGKQFLGSIRGLEIFKRAADGSVDSANKIVVAGSVIRSTIEKIRVDTIKASDGYMLAMNNMSIITRATVDGIMSLLRRLRLANVEAGFARMISRMSPTSVAKVLAQSSEEAVNVARRLGSESGTSLAFAFASSLELLQAMVPKKLRQIKIGKLNLGLQLFGKEANVAFRAFTRGADDAAAAAIALAESQGMLGKALRLLTAAQEGAVSRFAAVNVTMKLLSGGVLQLSNVFGFLIRMLTVLVTEVPIVGWFAAILMFSGKFRTAMGTLLGSVWDMVASIVGAVSSVVGSIGTIIGAILDLTGATSLIKIAVDVVVVSVQLLAYSLRRWASYLKLFALKVKEWVLNVRMTMVGGLSKIPMLGSYFRVDTNNLKAELEKVRKEIQRVHGHMEADAKQFKQKLIDIYGPTWSKALEAEFDAASKNYRQLKDWIEEASHSGEVSSRKLLAIVKNNISYYEYLLSRMKSGGATSKDIAQIENFISVFEKLANSIGETAKQVQDFVDRVNGLSAKIDVDLAPDAMRPFRELEQEIEKLKKDAEGQFNGADLADATAEVELYALKKRAALVRKYNEEFLSLYEDNEARIRDTLAKGTDDEIARLRYERDNAIREAEKRVKGQLKRYEVGSAEYVKLQRQSEREIEAIRRYYALRERQLLEDKLRKEKELYLNHYSEVLSLIATNNRKALELVREFNNGYFKLLDAQLEKERAIIERRKALGQISPKEANLEIAKAEEEALKRRIRQEEAYARAKYRVEKDASDAALKVEIQNLELQRQAKVANIRRSVANETERARLIAETNDYYTKIVEEKRRAAALETYRLKEVLDNKLASLQQQLASKQLEIDRLSFEKRQAFYSDMAGTFSKILSDAVKSGDLNKVSESLGLAETMLDELEAAGDEAAAAWSKLSDAVEKTHAEMRKLLEADISGAQKQIDSLKSAVSNWDMSDLDKAKRDVESFGSEFGVGLGAIEAALKKISGLPADVGASAMSVVKPFIKDINTMRDGLDALVQKRRDVKRLLDSGTLSPIDEAEARKALAQMDSVIKLYLGKLTEYIASSQDSINAAIDNTVSKRMISLAGQARDVEDVERQVAEKQLELDGKVREASVFSARERLRLAREYYASVVEYASGLLDKEEARRVVANARLKVLEAELGLDSAIKKQKSDALANAQAELDLEMKRLDLYRAQLKSLLTRHGVGDSLAGSYVEALTYAKELAIINRKIANANQAGDMSKVIDLQRRRVELEGKYLSNIKAVRAGVTDLISAMAKSITPSRGLYESLRSLAITSERFNADVEKVVSVGFKQWVASASDVADSLSQIETEAYGAGYAQSMYASRLANISDEAARASDAIVGLGASSLDAAAALRSGADAASSASKAYHDMASSARDAAGRIRDALSGLNDKRIDKILGISGADKAKILDDVKNFGMSISDAIDRFFAFNDNITPEQKRALVSYFKSLEDNLYSSERKLADVLSSSSYDPKVVSGVVENYKKTAEEIARRTDIEVGDILDTGLLARVGDKLYRDASSFDAKAQRAAAQASSMFDAYMDVIKKKADELGVSTEDILRSMKSIGQVVDPFANVDASRAELVAKKITRAVGSVASTVSGVVGTSVSTINDLVDGAISAIDRLVQHISEIGSRSINVKVNVEPSTPATIVPKVDAGVLSDAVGQVVADAISRAAANMSVEPTVNFNGEINETPELGEIAREIMPRVLDAIRDELDRRRALGAVGAG